MSVKNSDSIQRNDALQCFSRSFESTRPENLYLLSALFGFSAVDYHKASVLELGCGSGSNIIPLADSYPDCNFVGIDESGVLVAEGKCHIQNLSLSNIELNNMTLESIGRDFGEFDYIIVHGLYSWVSDSCQQKIIDICKYNLSEKGIALISYNTNPGWNVAKSFKDMMLYHAQSLPDMFEKARQNDASENQCSVKGDDGVMVPDVDEYDSFQHHVKTHNRPVLVQDFMEQVSEIGLQYVTDLDFMTFSPYLLPKDGRDVVLGISDKIQAEQCMDHIYHRRFRQTLLCHDSFKLSEEITTELMDRTKIRSKLRIIGEISFDQLRDRHRVSFEYKNYKVTTKDPVIKIALHLLECADEPLEWTMLINEIAGHQVEENRESIISILSDINFDQLLAYEVIDFGAKTNRRPPVPIVNPCATRFSRYQSRFTDNITNLHHQRVSLDCLGRTLLSFMDGSNTVSEALGKFRESIESSSQKTYTLGCNGWQKRIDREVILKNVDKLARHYIMKLSEQHLIG